MYVVDTSRYGEPALSSSELVLQDLENQGNDIVNDISERASQAGIETETIVSHGRPDEEIVDQADTIDADLTVLGFQRHSHSKEQNMGSVNSRVVRSTSRSVLITTHHR